MNKPKIYMRGGVWRVKRAPHWPWIIQNDQALFYVVRMNQKEYESRTNS